MFLMRRQSAVLPTLFIVCLLLLSSSPIQGYGRELGLKNTNTVKSHDVVLFEGIGKLRKEMMEVMDYDEPGDNTNPKNGFLVTPPRPPSLLRVPNSLLDSSSSARAEHLKSSQLVSTVSLTDIVSTSHMELEKTGFAI